jgi:hypothetical protein
MRAGPSVRVASGPALFKQPGCAHCAPAIPNNQRIFELAAIGAMTPTRH